MRFTLHSWHTGSVCLHLLQKTRLVNHILGTLDGLLQVKTRLVFLYWFGSCYNSTIGSTIYVQFNTSLNVQRFLSVFEWLLKDETIYFLFYIWIWNLYHKLSWILKKLAEMPDVSREIFLIKKKLVFWKKNSPSPWVP